MMGYIILILTFNSVMIHNVKHLSHVRLGIYVPSLKRYLLRLAKFLTGFLKIELYGFL